MRKLLASISLAMPLAVAAGCSNPELGMPAPFRSGSAPAQQSRAQHFDPYPTDAGGGDILGGRPEDYHEQIPEPARSRWTLPKFFTGRPVPAQVPTAAGSPPTVIVPPNGAQGYPTTGYPASGFSTGGSIQGGGAMQSGAVPQKYAPTVAVQRPGQGAAQPASYSASNGYPTTQR